MEEYCMRTITTVASVSLFALMLVAGCKSNPPQVAGKWHGANQLNATYSTTLSPKPKTQTAPADITLVLTQNGGAIQGEASVILFKNSRYHLPLKAGVISQDGKVSLEGDSDSTLSKAHFSFDGKATDGKLVGTVDFGFSNIGGTADGKGEFTFAPAQ
jgi:hypothetical protein